MRTWIYHKTEEPKIIEQSEYEAHEKKGWKDSPAPFMDIKDCGINADDAAKVQALGDSVQGIVDSLNGALNIDEMSKTELEEYAMQHYSVDVNPTNRKQLRTIKKAVKALVNK